MSALNKNRTRLIDSELMILKKNLDFQQSKFLNKESFMFKTNNTRDMTLINNNFSNIKFLKD